jgi:hypothetical protein
MRHCGDSDEGCSSSSLNLESQLSANYGLVCHAALIHISCLENRLESWALGQDRGQEGRAGTCPSLAGACCRKWELSREAGPQRPPCTAPGEGDMLSPGHARAWA